MILQDASPGDILTKAEGDTEYVVVAANEYDISIAWQDSRHKAMSATLPYESVMGWAIYIRTSVAPRQYILTAPIKVKFADVVKIKGESAIFVVTGVDKVGRRVYLHREDALRPFGWYPADQCTKRVDKLDMGGYAKASS
jgi:hypothetical protein